MEELNRDQIVNDIYGFKNRILHSKLAELVYAKEMLSIIDALALIEELTEENRRLKAFKEYFDGLYGKGLGIASWHLNGALEPFDIFYDSAQEMSED